MATKVKPTRLQVTGTPQAGDVPMYVDADNFQRGAGGGGNVKSFTLSSTSDITTAQEAYDWYDSGKVAIIIYNDKEYLFDYSTAGNAYWSVANEESFDAASSTGIRRATLQLALSSGTVTGVTTLNISINDFKVLRTDKDYGTPYTPQYNGSPATKKYVDDGLSTKADTSSLGTAAACDTGTGSGNVPVLDSNGKLNKTTLPGVALTDTFTVSTSSDLTSLSSAEQGDLAIVTTENKTYVLASEPYSTAANWKEILSPTGGVTSVNSQTGAVTLDADDISDSTTTNKFVTATDKSTWNGKQDALVSGTNIKTINNTSILGSGDLTVGGDVQVSTQNYNLFTPGMKIWGGGDTQFASLTPDSNTAYLVVPYVAVSSITLNESSISLTTVGQTYQLTATISPNNATYQNVTWSSSNTSIATVNDSGLVACVSVGNATITATVDGQSATCGVTGGGGGGWQPGANTLAYYPLDSVNTVNDLSGNNYNLTNNGNVTFGTVNGVDCATFGDGTPKGLVNTTANIISGQYTYLAWINMEMSSYGATDWARMFGGTNNWFILCGDLRNLPSVSMGPQHPPTNGVQMTAGWHLICFVGNTSDGSFTSYKDGAYVDSGTGATGSRNGIVIGAKENSYSSTGSDWYKGSMSKVIWENKQWTATEILDYYNQTKANYGIS